MENVGNDAFAADGRLRACGSGNGARRWPALPKLTWHGKRRSPWGGCIGGRTDQPTRWSAYW